MLGWTIKPLIEKKTCGNFHVQRGRPHIHWWIALNSLGNGVANLATQSLHSVGTWPLGWAECCVVHLKVSYTHDLNLWPVYYTCCAKYMALTLTFDLSYMIWGAPHPLTSNLGKWCLFTHHPTWGNRVCKRPLINRFFFCSLSNEIIMGLVNGDKYRGKTYRLTPLANTQVIRVYLRYTNIYMWAGLLAVLATCWCASAVSGARLCRFHGCQFR